MKVNGCGRAKILSSEERELLLTKGLLCQRDRTLSEVCYYLACRIAEARQLRYCDVFNLDGSVKSVVVLRKQITKGKQWTRSITMHDKFRQSLEAYVSDSHELLRIKEIVGNWDYKSLECGYILSSDGSLVCPQCGCSNLTTAGHSRGMAILKCRSCRYRFQENNTFLKYPDLKEAVIRLGVYNSYSYGCLFADPKNPFLFPGLNGKGCLSQTAAKTIFSKACDRVSIIGASTHSWRRTALSQMSERKVPLRVIQKISGHHRLSNLQKYLEVSPDQVQKAIRSLPFFTPNNTSEEFLDA